MGINVPVRPPAMPGPAAASARILNGVGVTARDWSWAASAAAYVRGRGCVLIPATASPAYSIPASTTRTFHFRAYQRYTCIQRLWIIRAHRGSLSGGETVTCTLAAPTSGTTQTYAVSGSTHIAGTVMYLLEDGVTQKAGAVNLTLDIANGSAATALVIDQIQCIELPRAQIAGGGSEHGADSMTDRGGDQIYAGGSGRSIGGVIDALNGIAAQTTRGGLFSWGVDDVSALSTASTTDVDVFQPAGTSTGNPKVRTGYPSKVGRSATTKTVQLYARMKVSGAGVGGRILVTTRLGTTGTLTVSPGSVVFATYTGTLVMDCESMSSADGRQSSANEELSVVWKNTGTAGTVYCSAFGVNDG